jgi:hypothetical protein
MRRRTLLALVGAATASLSGAFDGLSGRGDSDSLHVDVDGTTVELSVTATNFHGDYKCESCNEVLEIRVNQFPVA